MLAEEFKWYGNYRAKVTDNNIDNNVYGGVKVFIPDMMTSLDPEFDETEMGIVAYPASGHSIGAPNPESDPSFYQGSIVVPSIGSYVWIFFEGGDPNRPFYTASFNYKLHELPPENKTGKDPTKVYTLLKSHSGRSIVISDSDDNQRVEITGKKRSLSGPPSGKADSVSKIDGNQTVILLDERSGKDKFLIRTHKGDFLNIDIKNGELHVSFSGGIYFKSGGNITMDSAGEFHVAGEKGIFLESKSGDVNIKGMSTVALEATGAVSLRGATVPIDAAPALAQGASVPAKPAMPTSPKGDR